MKKLAIIVIFFLIFGQVVYVASSIAVNPFPTGDAYGIWFLKSKVMALANSAGDYLSFIQDPNYAFSHPEYPILWPMILSGVYRLGVNLMMVYPLLYILLLWLSYSIVAKKTGRIYGLIACFMVSTVTTIERFSGVGEVGFADLPLAVIMLFLIERYYEDKPNWWLMGIISGVMANIKFEGALAGVVFGVSVWPPIAYWIVSLPLTGAWLGFSRLMGLRTIYDGGILNRVVGNFDRVPKLFELTLKEMLDYGRYGLWPVIGIVSSGVKTNKKIRRVNLFIVFYMAILVGSYLLSPIDLGSHWNTSFYRLLSVVIPIIICNSSIMMLWNSEKKY